MSTTKKAAKAVRDPTKPKGKTGPKPLFGRTMTGPEKEARRKARIGSRLQEAINEARAAREAMERLAAESSRALAEVEQVPAIVEARARIDGAFEAAGRMMTALESTFDLQGQLKKIKVGG